MVRSGDPQVSRPPASGPGGRRFRLICGACGTELDASAVNVEHALDERASSERLPDGPVTAAEVPISVLWPAERLSSAFPDPDRLTPRERDIVRMLMQGYRVGSIAPRLGIATSTVYNHLRTIRMKYGASSQGELIELFHDRRPPPLAEGGGE